jgi:phosphatidylglycerol:prolipoprotein diacylglycerol transferase
LLTYPHIDPVLLQIGPFAIRWYALAYLTGVLSGWWLLAKMNMRVEPPILSKQAYDDIMAYAILGIILGGRLGYVLFYKPEHYFTHPLEIVMVWQGGMSFHGGLLGMITAMVIFSRKYKCAFLSLMDMLAVAAPIGLCLGRLANFINGELFGRITDSPLGMVFPTGGPFPRHPSQLYEASLEGIVLFIILVTIAFTTRALEKRGLLSGLFLIGYCAARSISEMFREPDSFIGYLPGGFTMGQLLSAPMLIIGAYLIIRSIHAIRT